MKKEKKNRQETVRGIKKKEKDENEKEDLAKLSTPS